jgi:hypothetical protein
MVATASASYSSSEHFGFVTTPRCRRDMRENTFQRALYSTPTLLFTRPRLIPPTETIGALAQQGDSTRRLSRIRAAVAFVAVGSLSLRPSTRKRTRVTPISSTAISTLSARRSDSC